ncbi:MAG: hypothetical protein ACRC5T_10680 [Cetobacterium sp.]
MNIDKRIYNSSFPSDNTLIKDLPKSIREKGDEIFSMIGDIENCRTTNSIKTTLEKLPNIQNLFLKGHPDIPSGVYSENNGVWYGFSNYDFLPSVPTDALIGERVTNGLKTYQLFKEGEIFVWSEKPSFEPQLFYDFFTITGGETAVLPNLGLNFQNSLEMSKIKRTENEFVPYVLNSKNSTIKTSAKYYVKNTLTVSATFNRLSREYTNAEIINPSYSSVVMFLRDEFGSVNIGMGIDKDNQLIFLNGESAPVATNSYLSTQKSYQLAIRYVGVNISFLVDGVTIYTTSFAPLNDKYIYFSFGDDQGYGRFANSQIEFGDPHVFLEAISKEENLWLKDNPRTWSMKKTKTYFDLNNDETLEMKELLRDKPYITKLDRANGTATNLKVDTDPTEDLHVIRKKDLVVKADLKHAHSATDLSLESATHNRAGVVMLSSDSLSTDTTKAVTPKALNDVRIIASHTHPFAAPNHSHVEFQNLINMINACKYDVGDVYITKKAQHPTDRWPGTSWTKIENRIIAATTSGQAPGALQGTNSISIYKANLPNITLKGSSNSTGGHSHENTHNHTATTSGHSHSIADHKHIGPPTQRGYSGNDWGHYRDVENERYKDGKGGSLAQHYTSPAGGQTTSNQTPTTSVASSRIVTSSIGDHAHSFTSESLGSGASISVLPEVIRYNVWERIG